MSGFNTELLNGASRLLFKVSANFLTFMSFWLDKYCDAYKWVAALTVQSFFFNFAQVPVTDWKIQYQGCDEKSDKNLYSRNSHYKPILNWLEDFFFPLCSLTVSHSFFFPGTQSAYSPTEKRIILKSLCSWRYWIGLPGGLPPRITQQQQRLWMFLIKRFGTHFVVLHILSFKDPKI